MRRHSRGRVAVTAGAGLLRPDQIVARRFRGTLLGASRAEVRGFLIEVAGAVAQAREALAREVTRQFALRKALEAARRRLDELEARLTVARRELASYRDPGPPGLRVPAGAPDLAEPVRPGRGALRSRRPREAGS